MPKLKTKSSAKKRFKVSADTLNLFFAELFVFNLGIIFVGVIQILLLIYNYKYSL